MTAKACGGVAEGVQKWLFVRVTRGVRNPVIVHPQFLAATTGKSRDILAGCLGTFLFPELWVAFVSLSSHREPSLTRVAAP